MVSDQQITDQGEIPIALILYQLSYWHYQHGASSGHDQEEFLA